MPQNLPNGLVCPERGDNNDLACEQVKALFVAVDALQTIVGDGTDPNETQKQNISAGGWLLNGPADCKVYTQTITVPAGVDPACMIFQAYDSNGNLVFLDVTVTGPGTITLQTNTPTSYTGVYA